MIMDDATLRSAHTFSIPVMGTGFLVDTPLKVARYGISSVISLVDDSLIEQVRRFHLEQEGEPYEEIRGDEEDARARRITAYLDLVDRLVARQVRQLQASPFEPGSEITRYFEMLPPCGLQQAYREMLATADPQQRAERQEQLRPLAVPGSIDVNIMSKLDRTVYRDGEPLPAKYSDAAAALRGFALSTVRSAMVFSAGMNPRLYSYLAEFEGFFPDLAGVCAKRIILKVSDYHSATVQGKYLAKRGLWVSEYRIESGLNCGGHAFATKGLLLGPILEEFRKNRHELGEQLRAAYCQALTRAGRPLPARAPEIRVTVQGGIGTAEEDRMLRDRYGVEGTGWGTPFLLVPEATSVDPEHLVKLAAATEEDVYLSECSPIDVPIWTLRNSASENMRRERIARGAPGSPCSKGHAKLYNTEFTKEPICTASRQYQRMKLAQLAKEDLPEEQRERLRQSVLAKACICHDLAGGATLKYGIDLAATPAICCGPNIVNFSKITTLDEMVGHIYGRLSLLVNPNRPHMFLKELALYIDHLSQESEKCAAGLSARTPEYLAEFRENLLGGIEHYRQLAGNFVEELKCQFLEGLEKLNSLLDETVLTPVS